MDKLLKYVLLVNIISLIFCILIIPLSIFYEHFEAYEKIIGIFLFPIFGIFMFIFPIFIIYLSVNYFVKEIKFVNYLRSLLIPLSYIIGVLLLAGISLNVINNPNGGNAFMAFAIAGIQSIITMLAVVIINFGILLFKIIKSF